MQAKRLNQLQFLRFIAFGFIFLFHAFGSNLEPHIYTTNAAYAMVSFFFILSGFDSGYSSADRRQKPTLKAIGSHLWKKIKKIYPILFVTTIYFVLMSDLPQAINNGDWMILKECGWNLIKCLLMIQSWWNPYLFYNGVTWFISTILFLYLFDLPVRYWLDKLHDMKREKSILTGLSVGLAVFIVIVATLESNRVNMGYYLYAFPIPVNSYSMQVYWLLPNLIVLIIMGLGKGLFSKIFSMKLFKDMGDISMECYLLHQPVLMTYTAFVQMDNTIREHCSISFLI